MYNRYIKTIPVTFPLSKGDCLAGMYNKKYIIVDSKEGETILILIEYLSIFGRLTCGDCVYFRLDETSFFFPLQWRHHERLGVSNHRQLNLSGADQRKHQSSASLAFVRKSTVTYGFQSQKASNAENVSIWWRHYALACYCVIRFKSLAPGECGSNFNNIIFKFITRMNGSSDICCEIVLKWIP